MGQDRPKRVSDGCASRKLSSFMLLLGGLVTGLCLICVSMLADMRREAWNAAIDGSRNVVVSEVTNIQQFLRIYDASLRSTTLALADSSVMAAAPALRQRALFDRVLDTTFLGPVRILDATGQVLADSVQINPSPASASELRALGRHRESASMGPMIGLPTTIADGDHQITLSRRIDRPDGRFGGIVCGTIRLGFLTERFGILGWDHMISSLSSSATE